ncbi:TolC family protein [Sandaracinus amylolyticus]|uniref:TolC family protein n=1 Tax=Sandaracinus amylolyticus TaxID=927083 RepID=UPI001F327E90|nr:TolC family protein [Sandaracinus amylolyticus]UJR82951.1 Hypothetical protein I5071_50160 [Sandaracinus amylolyticus]
MRAFGWMVAAIGGVVCWCASSSECRALTLEEALARARARAPDVIAARHVLAEARGELTSAEVPLRANPLLEAQAGPRYTVDGEWILQLAVGIEQTFELSGARDARIDAARARIDAADAEVADVARVLSAEVAARYLAALAARDRAALSEAGVALLGAMLGVIVRRVDAGDASIIDARRVELARAAAVSERDDARAAMRRELGALRLLLGAASEEPLEVEGDLATLAVASDGALDGERADVAAARAREREARARVRIAEALAVPELIAGLSYQLEEGDHMGLVTLGVTLPVFDDGRGEREQARARHEAARAELERRESTVAVQIATAREAYRAALDALTASVDSARSADEVEALVARAWEAGELPVGDVLVARREVVEARAQLLSRARDAALARTTLEAAIGGAR